MAARIPARIPEDITAPTPASRDLRDGIRDILITVLNNMLGFTSNRHEIFVNCRLNRSDQLTGPSPVCVGWVESPALAASRSGMGLADPGASRFGDDHLSPVYAECLNDRNMNVVVRDFSQPGVVVREKIGGARSYDVNLGLVHRRYVCIRASGRRAGTLTVGFSALPANDTQVQNALRYWAQDSSSPLVQYLENHFHLGGPTV